MGSFSAIRGVVLGGALLACVSAAPAARIPADTFVRSDTCGDCHKDIYAAWRESVHARAMDDPSFLKAYRDLETRSSSASRVCLKCHAPLAELGGDPELSRRVTWEGVTCDFCHSIDSVTLTKAGPRHHVTMGIVKRGPIRDAHSTGHDVAYSELHERSLICAPCHEYDNSDGVPVLTTYSEWKESKAARLDVQCQSCHMPATLADVVDPRIKRDPRAKVNTHAMPGGHSLRQLHKALRVSIRPQRADDTLHVEVDVENRGAGHAVPTGMPGRRIILEVGVDVFGGKSFRERKVYGKSFLDARDRRITRVSDYFRPGVRQTEDTRIRADEIRRESFRFPVPADRTANVTVKLHYEHATGAGEVGRRRLTFLSETRLVRAVQ